MAQTIFVAGATGIQGGAVVRRLISYPDTTVHVLVRDPNSLASQTLQSLSANVRLFTGNFDDLDTIRTATKSCIAAFLNVTPVFTDSSGEARHAQNLVAACVESQVARVIYSSSGAMDAPLNDPVWTDFVPNNPNDWMGGYMKSKKACEDAVITGNFTDGWFIIRGGTFMTNLLPPHGLMMYPQLAADQIITTALKEDYVMSFLDPEDLGKFAADVLRSSTEWDRYKHQAVAFGVQNLTLKQFIDAANDGLRKAGAEKQIKIHQLSEEEAQVRAGQGDIFVSSQLFQNKYHGAFKEEELRRVGIDGKGMTLVGEFFDKKREELIAAVGES